MSHRHGVVPLVYRQLSETFADSVPEEQLNKFRERYRKIALSNVARTGELCRLLKLFTDHGLGVLPYKGPALAVEAYEDLTLRQFSDLDVLIRREDLRSVTALLAEENYAPEFDLDAERERPFKKWWYVQPFRQRASGVYLEVHWALAPFFFSFDFELESLWGRTRRIKLAAGCEVEAPSVEDTLLLLCVHGAKDLWVKLEWVSALAEFVRRHAQLDWRGALRRARELGAERMLLLGLLLARRLYDAEPPAFVSEKLESPSLKSLASQVEREYLREHKSSRGFFGRMKFHLKAREHLRDRARYCARAATATSPSEWDILRLPPSLFFIYSFMRPLRLAKNFLSDDAKKRPSR